MKNLNLGVRAHSPSAATTSQIASAQEVCDPLYVATGSPHSVLFGAWILLRPARNPMRKKGPGMHISGFALLANFGLRC